MPSLGSPEKESIKLVRANQLFQYGTTFIDFQGHRIQNKFWFLGLTPGDGTWGDWDQTLSILEHGN